MKHWELLQIIMFMIRFKVMVLVIGALAIVLIDSKKEEKRERSFIGWIQVTDENGNGTREWIPANNQER